MCSLYISASLARGSALTRGEGTGRSSGYTCSAGRIPVNHPRFIPLKSEANTVRSTPLSSLL